MAAKKQDMFAHPIRKYQTLLTKAKDFFNAEKEKEYQPIVIFVFLYVLVGQILEFVAWVPSLGSIGAAAFPAQPLLNIVLGIFGIVLRPILTLLFTFIVAGAMHLMVRYYKKDAAYFQTWKVVAYATLIPIIYNVFLSILTTGAESLNQWPEQSIYAEFPVFGPYYLVVLCILFIIGFIALIHTLYTEIIGLSIYHKLTTQQATVAVIVPLLILSFIIVAFVMALLMIARLSGIAF